MNGLLYLIAKGLISLIQSLPLLTVARLGRFFGGLVYYLDRRHRRTAISNLTMCFRNEKTPAEIKSIAKENFKRIGENFASAVKTASMTNEELRPHLEFSGARTWKPGAEHGLVGAVGHFGNFELYARLKDGFHGYRMATTYRGLRQAAFNTLLQQLRARSTCKFFERRFDAGPLKAFMKEPGAVLGFLADQHAGSTGVWIPFLGHECSTSAAPAVFALRYHCNLFTAICYRIGLARWRVEIGPDIPTMSGEKPRSTSEIMLDVNRVFEQAIRRDPANWFWVHRRWKPRGRTPAETSAPKSAEGAQIKGLP